MGNLIKKVIVAVTGSLLLITGCAPAYDTEEKIVQETSDKNKRETAIVPSYNISDDEYKVILPYKSGESRGVIYNPGEARGIIVNQLSNRLDIGEFETGLKRHAKTFFEPEDFYFQEGQYLTKEIIYQWLERRLTDEEVSEYLKNNPSLSRENLQNGLNPPLEGGKDNIDAYRENPRYLSHILEHNFLKKNDQGLVELGGISIGIALKSNYRFQTVIDGRPGPYFYEEISEEEMVAKGEEIANTIVQRIRRMDELDNVPIMVALYREEKYSAVTAGNFVAKTIVEPNDMTVKEWKTIDENYILYPSQEANETYFEDAANMKDFEEKVAQYFPNYVGVIGKGFYVDGNLQELKIDIPIEFYGKGEVIGFTQYVYGLLMETFPNFYQIEINITSIDQPQSLIVRKAGEEKPFVHIYE